MIAEASREQLVAFLYLLVRDELPAGAVWRLVQQAKLGGLHAKLFSDFTSRGSRARCSLTCSKLRPRVSGVLLFKPQHVGPLLVGRKVETRRLWARARAREGAVHQVYVRPAFAGGSPFGVVLVRRVWQEPLGAISAAGAEREGYGSRELYFEAFRAINRAPVPLSRPVFAVLLEVREGFPVEAARIHAGELPACCASCPCELAAWLRSVAP